MACNSGIAVKLPIVSTWEGLVTKEMHFGEGDGIIRAFRFRFNVLEAVTLVPTCREDVE
jgi:hypothetical protein